jgi:hypothetical protein
MAITTTQGISVGTTATLLYTHPLTTADAGNYLNKDVVLINASATPVVVYLGASGVSTSTGVRWLTDLGLAFAITIEPGESIYGVVTTGTQLIDVMASGR